MVDNDAAEDTLLTLTADIVAAHVSNNSVAVSDLPNLIQNVHQALTGISSARAASEEKPEPKVSIRSSIKRRYGWAFTPPPNIARRFGHTSVTRLTARPRRLATSRTRSKSSENQQVVPDTPRTS